MPTYQYECQACGHAFEEWQAMSDPKLRECPKCHKNSLARLIGGGSAMIFKGSGFYETDFKKKSSPIPDVKGSPKPSGGPSSAPVGPCGRPCSCH